MNTLISEGLHRYCKLKFKLNQLQTMRKWYKKVAYLLLFGVGISATAQQTFKPNGVQNEPVGLYAFKNATIHLDGDNVIENALLFVKGDKIEAVGANFALPAGTIVYDLKGKHIYPGLVDAYANYGVPEVKRSRGGRNFYQTQFDSEKKGAYNWNQAVHPEVNAAEQFVVDAKSAETMRKIGFGVAVTHQPDGIARGTSALVSFYDGSENIALLQPKVATHYSFNKGSSSQTFPVSLMGAVALLRQTLYDADWYKKGGNTKERNISLEAINQTSQLPRIFEAANVLDVLRADRIGDEFGTQFIIKTKGDEYQKIAEVKATNASLVVPINYPDAYDVEDPYDAERTSLTDMKHWELAPKNTALLHQAGIPFSITSADLTKKDMFWTNLRKAVQYGLPISVALNAITSVPAKQLQVEGMVGKIQKGMLANFFISSEDIFNTNAKIHQNWIQGKPFEFIPLDKEDIRGDYSVDISNRIAKLAIKGTIDKPTFEMMVNDTVKITPKVTLDGNLVTISFVEKGKTTRLSGYKNGANFMGKGLDGDGKEVAWTAMPTTPFSETAPKSAAAEKEIKTGEILYPFTAFGAKEKPKAEDLLIKNTTVWTNEKEGILQNTDVLIENGKIAKIGKNLTSKTAKTVDGQGKHLTAGVIDEHSHIALLSINEVETVSSEVRQGDVINSEDVNIYRQLAGGVTTSQLLHGSADCIGGQSAIIKLKWGESPENLKFPQAPEFIKFALGENVKRGNAPTAPDRYPATRMGVEQVYYDAFTRAKEYAKAWKEYNALKNKTGVTPPRKDLELDALVEILEDTRHITCHSYVQSEINMLMNVADSMGFKVNTFTHILEGYKVADKMKQRQIAASTFSDWWAYKMEVKEAIPFNAAMLHKAGVLTAINSDDAEMARRLNQEAAKAVLYGGLSEEDAWKTVTLNPAKMMRIDHKVGSIKVGKDADVVLWTNNPLSVYARPEKTIIDGTVYFDREKDEILRKEAAAERNRLVQIMLAQKAGGAPTQKARPMTNSMHIHCDTIVEYGGISSEALDMTLRMKNQSQD